MMIGLKTRHNDHRPSPETFRQPTAYLVKVTSLSPGLPPQRLAGEYDPQPDMNPKSGSFRRGLTQCDESADVIRGVESNPFRIEVMVVGPFLG